jgi:hypothetical protein
MNKRRAMLIAVVGLLCVIAWRLLHPAHPEAGVAGEASRSSMPGRAAAGATERSGLRQHGPSIASRLHGHKLTRHEAEQLKDFILPRIEGREVSLREALRILEEAYQEACFRSREQPLDLGFSVRDEPDHALSFMLRGRSFLACLDHLAALAGLSVERNGLNFELLRGTTADQPAELSLQAYAPALPQLRELAGLQASAGESDWESLLRSAGFIREQATTLREGGDGFLWLHGSNAEIARVRSALTLATEPPAQIVIGAKLITTTAPLDLPQRTFTGEELQQLLHSLAQQPQAQLVTQPSVCAREGELATVEMIRETMADGESGWTGIKSAYQANRTGMKVVANDHSEQRPTSPEEATWIVDTDFAVSPGDTHMQLLSSRDGSYQYRLLTVTPVDATGRPLGNVDDVVFEDPDAAAADQAPSTRPAAGNPAPVANRVPGSPRFVVSPYSNQPVDVEGIPPGTLVADPSFPATERKYFRVP